MATTPLLRKDELRDNALDEGRKGRIQSLKEEEKDINHIYQQKMLLVSVTSTFVTEKEPIFCSLPTEATVGAVVS